MRSNRPAFFKFFFPDSSAEQLEIPSAFTTSIQSALPNKVVLRDRHNNIWRVKLVKVGDKLHLADGWPKFVEENCITGGDMLVFEYFCNGLFYTKILGPSACEKKGVTTEQKTSVEEENESSDDNYVSDSETDDEDSEEEIHANDSARKKRKQGTREKSGRTRRVLSDIYGVEIFRSGLARQPENPYFVAKVNPKRKSEFYIPKDLVIDHNLELPEEISFVDPNGRRWTSKRKIWKGGRTFYTKGWRKLCQCNFVKEDDICICEFIKIDQEHCVKVSFVRADGIRNDEHD